MANAKLTEINGEIVRRPRKRPKSLPPPTGGSPPGQGQGTDRCTGHGMTVHICDTTICPLRAKCFPHAHRSGDEVHVTHFRPQEEFSPLPALHGMDGGWRLTPALSRRRRRDRHRCACGGIAAGRLPRSARRPYRLLRRNAQRRSGKGLASTSARHCSARRCSRRLRPSSTASPDCRCIVPAAFWRCRL